MLSPGESLYLNQKMFLFRVDVDFDFDESRGVTTALSEL